MKYVHIFIIILFLLFAFWQINDPDPFRWILLYLGVAACPLFILTGKKPILLPVAGMLVCIVGMVFLFPDLLQWIQDGMPSITRSMKAESPYIELVREFLGFTISGIFFLIYFCIYKRKRS
jgi:hypothetical protein